MHEPSVLQSAPGASAAAGPSESTALHRRRRGLQATIVNLNPAGRRPRAAKGLVSGWRISCWSPGCPPFSLASEGSLPTRWAPGAGAVGGEGHPCRGPGSLKTPSFQVPMGWTMRLPQQPCSWALAVAVTGEEEDNDVCVVRGSARQRRCPLVGKAGCRGVGSPGSQGPLAPTAVSVEGDLD